MTTSPLNWPVEYCKQERVHFHFNNMMHYAATSEGHAYWAYARDRILNLIKQDPVQNLSIVSPDQKELDLKHIAFYHNSYKIASNFVLNGFSWLNTPEGQDYWSDLYGRLLTIADLVSSDNILHRNKVTFLLALAESDCATD